MKKNIFILMVFWVLLANPLQGAATITAEPRPADPVTDSREPEEEPLPRPDLEEPDDRQQQPGDEPGPPPDGVPVFIQQ